MLVQYLLFNFDKRKATGSSYFIHYKRKNRDLHLKKYLVGNPTYCYYNKVSMKAKDHNDDFNINRQCTRNETRHGV